MHILLEKKNINIKQIIQNVNNMASLRKANKNSHLIKIIYDRNRNIVLYTFVLWPSKSPTGRLTDSERNHFSKNIRTLEYSSIKFFHGMH